MPKRIVDTGHTVPAKWPAIGRKGVKKATLPRTVRGAARIVTRAHKAAFKELKKH